MKSYLKLLTAACAACFLTVTASAAETAPASAHPSADAASPTGTWKWSQPGRNGGPAREQTLKLDNKDGKLTGTLVGGQGPNGAMPDVQIANASFKDGVIAFSVTREFNGNSMVTKYTGKLAGDTITGSSERERNGETQKTDWVATRAK